MACVNMYNPEHHQSFMAPRISFSSDFALEPPPPSAAAPLSARAPGDADFEFSVGSHPMMAADQLFSKGRILPLKDGFAGRPPTTLRDELRGGADDERASAKGSRRWKEMLGLRKAICVGAAAAAANGAAKKNDKVVVLDAEMVTDMAASN